MKIQYLGHSSFLLCSKSGTRVVTDPYGGVGFAMPRIAADAVTVSHGHYDHNNVAAVETGVVLSRAGAFTVGDMKIRAVPSFHDDAHGGKRGANLIFLFEADGVTVCHMGDIGEPCTRALAENIGYVDALLLPVGGNYTVDARGAKAYADALMPSIIVPMHYHTDGLNIDIAPPDAFLALYPAYERVRGEFEIVPANGQRVVLMERWK